MEQNITIVALVLSFAGIGYLKMEQLERMALAAEAAAAQAVQDSIQRAEAAELAAIEAATTRFTIPHDHDVETNDIDLVLDGSGSMDAEADSLTFLWEQVGGFPVDLDTNGVWITSMTASPGEYTFKLTVTDSYGQSSSEEAIVAIGPEPNAPPDPRVRVYARN